MILVVLTILIVFWDKMRECVHRNLAEGVFFYFIVPRGVE